MTCLTYYMFSTCVVPWYHWKYFTIIFFTVLRWGFSILNARAYLGKDLQDLAELYIYKNYYIDVFHFDDYLNKQFMGSSENQFLMPHAKSMVIFLFLLKGSFAVWTTPVCTWIFQNNCWNAFPVKKLLAATTFHTTRRRLYYRLEYGRTLNTNWVSKQILWSLAR